MAGVATSILFVGEQSRRWPTFRSKATYALAFAAIILLAGYFLTPLGISKIRATPTWSLYCVGSSIIIFTLLYYICDVQQKTRWAAFTKAPGSNTLLTYLLRTSGTSSLERLASPGSGPTSHGDSPESFAPSSSLHSSSLLRLCSRE